MKIILNYLENLKQHKSHIISAQESECQTLFNFKPSRYNFRGGFLFLAFRILFFRQGGFFARKGKSATFSGTFLS